MQGSVGQNGRVRGRGEERGEGKGREERVRDRGEERGDRSIGPRHARGTVKI